MPKPAKSTTAAQPKPTMGESIRETVDSVVIAFVLAFLFRTFEAEAFVIPTGSMALTLLGDHKDVRCEQCGYQYRVSASGESPQNRDDQRDFDLRDAVKRDAWRRNRMVMSSMCPNCRYRMNYGDAPPPSYKGDRILVTKYTYDFVDPKRWDVAVFKNPSQAKINYIKRIAGLPSEEILIYRGDVYVRGPKEEKFHIARKPHEKAASVAQVVYDNDYVRPEIHERGWPQRWVSELTGSDPLWIQSDDLKSFRLPKAAEGEAWLRYQHFVPGEADWAVLAEKSLDPPHRARLKPQLITDFCEYNTERSLSGLHHDLSYLGYHWIGDIGVECELEFLDRAKDDAEAVLEIVEGGVAYQCRIRAASGDVVLAIAGLDGYAPTAKGAVRGNGPHRLRFANVDDQLLVWVDGGPVTFDASTNFQSADVLAAEDGDGKPKQIVFDGESRFPPLANLVPKRQDLSSPIGIGAKGMGLAASKLRVLRDIYYVADSNMTVNAEQRGDLSIRDYRSDVFHKFVQAMPGRNLPIEGGEDAYIRAFMSDVDTMPERWSEASFVHFKMEPEQYFVLGDNSPRSLDGRLWDPGESYVKQELLIGKALLVYWPHGWGTIPGVGVNVPALPLIGGHYLPDFTRMRMIR